MSSVLYDVLEETLLGVEGAGGRLSVSLAELLARLSRGDATEMTALQPHQQHAWHAFVVQLAATVAHRHDGALPRDAAVWREDLRTIAGSREAFCLVVENLAKPAFMQPPVPEGTVAEWETTARPDDPSLNLLVTSKNHDVKQARVRVAAQEHWVYALVTLQTMQGYSGKANYGIVRMNSGFGNRPALGAARSAHMADRFAHDVRAWLGGRKSLVEEHGFAPDGVTFVWTMPWAGTKAERLPLAACDPFFVEVCRRVRLGAAADGRMVAHRRPTEESRIDGDAVLGRTGDAWTPVSKTKSAALTVPGDGFTYRRLQELLFGDDWIRSAAQAVSSEDGDEPVLLAWAIPRGQGKTEGLHERIVPVPKRAKALLETPEGRAKLGVVAAEWIKRVGTMRLKVLKPALLALLQGGPEKLKLDDERVDPLRAQLDATIDARFFTLLFEHAGDAEAGSRPFDEAVLAAARDVLDTAIRSAPLPGARRYRAIAAASHVFEGAAFNQHFRLHTQRAGEEPDGTAE